MDQVEPYFINSLSSRDDVAQQIPSFCEIKSNISKDKGVVENSLENGDPDLSNNGCKKDSLKSEEKTEIPGWSTVSVTPDVESSNNTVETSENRDCKLTPFNREDSKEVQNNTVMKIKWKWQPWNLYGRKQSENNIEIKWYRKWRK